MAFDFSARRYTVVPFVIKGTFTLQEEVFDGRLTTVVSGGGGVHHTIADAQAEADELASVSLKHLKDLLSLTETTLEVITGPNRQTLLKDKESLLLAIDWCLRK